MNELTTEVILNPDEKLAECVKFTIDNIIQPFIFHDIKNVGQEYTFSTWVKSEGSLKLIINETEFDIGSAWTKIELTLTADTKNLEMYFTDNGVYYLYHPKFEIGNHATDWTPAPEDIARQKDLEVVEGKLIMMETSIEQNKEAISLAATKTEMTLALGNYYTKEQSDANLTVKANEITSTVASTYATKTIVNGLETDLNNLEGDVSDLDGSLSDVISRVGQAETKIDQNSEAIDLRATKSEVTTTLGNYYTKEQTDANLTVKANEITSTVASTYATKTDVSDVTARVTSAETNILQNSDSITSVATRTSNVEDLTTYALRKNGTVDLSDTTIYDEDTYYPVVANTNIRAGGYRIFQVNVQLNSGSVPSWSTHDNGFTCNLTARMKAHGWGTAPGNLGWIDDFYYTWCDKMPAYIWQMTNNSRAVFFLRGGGKYHIYSDYDYTWTPYTTDFTVSSQTVSPTTEPSNYSSLVDNWSDHTDLTNAKVNISNVESLAGDNRGRIVTAESTIEQLSDCIHMLVTDAEGTSLMEQTSTGWTFCVGNLQTSLENAQNDLSDLTESLGSTDATVSDLQQAVNDIGDLNNYINIGTYEGEPCIELGKIDSDFKVIITNTRIMFMEGSNVPTYISNRTLITEKVEVVNELHQGGFVWVTHNGNLGLIWKGEGE